MDEDFEVEEDEFVKEIEEIDEEFKGFDEEFGSEAKDLQIDALIPCEVLDSRKREREREKEDSRIMKNGLL